MAEGINWGGIDDPWEAFVPCAADTKDVEVILAQVHDIGAVPKTEKFIDECRNLPPYVPHLAGGAAIEGTVSGLPQAA